MFANIIYCFNNFNTGATVHKMWPSASKTLTIKIKKAWIQSTGGGGGGGGACWGRSFYFKLEAMNINFHALQIQFFLHFVSLT